MVERKRILVIDKYGMAPSLISGLEKELECDVGVYRELSKAKSCLDNLNFDLVIADPFIAGVGVSEAYVRFIKQELKDRNILVLIFSRISVEKLEMGAQFGIDLKKGRDYQTYLRKPANPNRFVEEVRGLIYH